jgi:hypothetical protein
MMRLIGCWEGMFGYIEGTKLFVYVVAVCGLDVEEHHDGHALHDCCSGG